MARCRNGRRHWFTVYGNVGLRAPTCRHCGDPNPNFTEQDQREYDAVMEQQREIRERQRTAAR